MFFTHMMANLSIGRSKRESGSSGSLSTIPGINSTPIPSLQFTQKKKKKKGVRVEREEADQAYNMVVAGQVLKSGCQVAWDHSENTGG